MSRIIKILITGTLGWSMLAVAQPNSSNPLLVAIGFSSPLTGPQAEAGKDNLGGLQMAAEQLNNAGTLIGGRRIEFKVDAGDDQADPRAGVSVAQIFIDAGVKAVIGPYNSGVAIPASRVYEQAGIPMLSVSTNPRLTQQGYHAIFRLVNSDAQLGSKMATYAASELKIKSVAVIDDRSAYGQGLAASFTAAAQAAGIQIVDVEYTNDRASDFNAILTAIKRKKPDAIFFGGYAQQAGPMLRQISQLKMNSLFLGGDGICNNETGRLAGAAAAASIYCINGSASAPLRKQFNVAYEKRFHHPPDYFAVYFYDGLLMVAEAMRAAGTVEPAHYLPVLEKLSYNGAGRHYRFNDTHDQIEAPVTIYHFKNGDPIPLVQY